MPGCPKFHGFSKFFGSAQCCVGSLLFEFFELLGFEFVFRVFFVCAWVTRVSVDGFLFVCFLTCWGVQGLGVCGEGGIRVRGWVQGFEVFGCLGIQTVQGF